MGNDIQISVRVSNQTGAGLAAANTSLQGLKSNAQQAGQGLNTLTSRSAAASQSLRLLDTRAQSATSTLRGLRTAAGDIRVTASIDDQTSTNVASIKAALRDLKRESPVRLTAQFDGNAGQITAAATAMRDLRGDANGAGAALTSLTTRAAASAAALNSLEQQAEDASRALRTLRGRAAAASAAMGEFRDRVTAVATALRTFNTRAQTADGRLNALSTRTRTVRGDMDELDGSVGRLTGSLGGLRTGLGSLPNVTSASGNSMRGLRAAAIALSPALIPIAAVAVPMAAGLGAAGVAVMAFGVAIGGQIATVMEAAQAEKKYRDAVKEHGTGSAEAAKAAHQIQLALKDMPRATQEAAVGLTLMKTQYTRWSDSLADSTMPVATKAFAAFGALFPKMSPLVRGASGELDRLMTVMAGGIQSDGFSRFMASFSEFASGALARATTGLVKFSQSMDTGKVGGNFSEFMAYARDVGPAVGETLGNLAKSMIHLVAAASDLGVGILTAVNALAQLVNAIPTGALSTFIQMYAALKLVSVGIGLVGAAAGGSAVGRLAAYFAVMRAAGVSTTMRATAASMSGVQKAAVGLGVLAVAAIGISKIAENARGAPPNVDRLTTSLKNLATTGKFTGELKATFGDVDGLVKKYKQLGSAAKDQEEYVKSFGSSGIGPLDDLRRSANDLWQDLTKGEDSRKALTADFDAMDESLAGLVASGNTEQAAKDFALVREALRGDGKSDAEIDKTFDGYKAGLANLAEEQRLAAEGMGLFGQQALGVQERLTAQQSSADGLAQSINALSNAYLMARGGVRGMEAAIDAADAAFKKNGQTLDENTAKGRGNNQALDDIASSTMKAAESARANGASWETVNGIYDRGRKKLLSLTEGVTGNEAAARRLAAQILKTPSKTARIKMQKEDAERDLKAFNGAVKRSPGSKSVTLKTLSKAAEGILTGFGYKVKRLPNGSVRVTAKTGAAVSGIRSVQGAVNSLSDRTITIRTNHVQTVQAQQKPFWMKASGGRVPSYASGGDVQAFPNGGYVNGPGTGTSDSIVAAFPSGAMGRISNTEYVMRSAAVARYGVGFMDAINAGRLKVPGFAKGGLTKGQKAAKARAAAQAKGERDARGRARGELTVSHFGKTAGYQRSEFGSALSNPDSIGSLVNSLNQWRGVIMKATHGGRERSLLRQLDSTGRALLKQERSLSKVTDQLDKARSKLSDLKSAAAGLASSVKSSILGSANITKGASGEGRVTTASIMGGLISSRDKATAFTQALEELKAKGLDKGLLSQVAEAGIDGGGLETATGLLGASNSEIQSMNQLQAEIAKAATAAGKTTADAVYGAQIKAQEKVVGALKSVQEKLTKSMDKLTKAMEKAIERAFSKKASGGIVGAAASGGVRGGLTLTGEEGPEIVRLPVGSRVYPTGQSKRMAWESMLTEPPKRPGVRPPQGAGGGPPELVVIELRSSGSDVDEFLLKMLRKAIRVRGGNAQVVLGRAGT
ncbi:phage tail protein [Streptomyces sp. H27-C3]|uniref:phage tail protein n=1 Tax=Streptomyces sp. H27-C3 TaxID=3046305 RepID=UPI0024BB90B1|nr:phage tail protein [Streptomyces sp. H27-C3]MDJ0460578.1 phage tail protein [Streptomyces sp. H27-C3]